MYLKFWSITHKCHIEEWWFLSWTIVGLEFYNSLLLLQLIVSRTFIWLNFCLFSLSFIQFVLTIKWMSLRECAPFNTFTFLPFIFFLFDRRWPMMLLMMWWLVSWWILLCLEGYKLAISSCVSYWAFFLAILPLAMWQHGINSYVHTCRYFGCINTST